jgi:hypothetical protein
MRRPSAALIALLLGTYAYFYQAGGWNQNSRFDLVRAVVEDGSLRIDRFADNTGDVSVRDDHRYCDKAPGASALCLPTYAALFALAGAPAPVPPGWLAWAAWLSIVLAVGVPSAVAAVFLARLARALGLGPVGSIVLALAWGLATMALPYATLLYGNQLAADLTLIAFALLVEIRGGAEPTAGRMLAVGALLGFAGATEYPAALIMAPIAVYGLFVAGGRRAGWAVLGGALPLAGLLAYHAAAFGSPLAFPYDYSTWEEPSTGWFMGIGRPVPGALRNILFGEYRGLLYTTPWLGLALPGAVLLARRHRAEVAVCVVAVSGFLWLNSSIPPWDGGWAAGPRYLVPMLPFAAALAGGVVAAIGEAMASVGRGRRATGVFAAALFAGLVSLSAANMLAVTAVKPEIPTEWERPYAELVWPSFLGGRLSISTQSIDMFDNPPDAPRQAWNLGMKCGLDGHASLLPLSLWAAACTGWLAWTLRRGPAVPGRAAEIGGDGLGGLEADRGQA